MSSGEADAVRYTPDQHKVMVNGAAVALLQTMFNTLRDDLASTEQRLTAQFDQRFTAHESYHVGIEREAEKQREKLSARLHDVEDWKTQTIYDETVATATRDGQMWFVTKSVGLLRDNSKALLGLAALAIGFLTGLIGPLALR